jgi:hypothetical protein
MVADEIKGDSGCEPAAAMDRQGVATILGISWQAVQETERRALWKLRNNPVVRRIYREYTTGEAVPCLDGRRYNHRRERISERIELSTVTVAMSEWAELAARMEVKGCPEEAQGVRAELRRLAEWLGGKGLEIADLRFEIEGQATHQSESGAETGTFTAVQELGVTVDVLDQAA